MNDLINQPWLQFSRPEVRQLAFAVASPPLLKNWPDQMNNQAILLPDHIFWLQHFENFIPYLKQLDKDSSPLQLHLSQLRSTRLGIRFEGLLAFWLLQRNYHPYEILGQSIKRMDGQRTLGEMDFLLRNQETGQVEHWEVAIKFYLGENSFTADQWLGLNRRDTMGRKIQHLVNHQFDVQHVDGHSIDVQQAVIKGRLFYPIHQTYYLPSWLNDAHLSGLWGYRIPSVTSPLIWRRAARHEWLCEAMASIPAYSATYWSDGLYFGIREGQVQQRFMLRQRYPSYTLFNIAH